MSTIQENDRKASFVYVGNFNAHHREWLNFLSPANFSTESGREQVIHKPTHRSGNTLDLTFTYAPTIVASNVGSPTGTSSPCFVSAYIKIEQAISDESSSHKIYPKSQADWNGDLSDFFAIKWSHFYHKVDRILESSTTYEGIIGRRIPSQNATFCNKDKALSIADCRRAYLDKEEDYNLWKRNCS